MNYRELTGRVPLARTLQMQGTDDQGRCSGQGRPKWFGRAAAMVVAGSMLSGCVSVNAPDKPIVIELNINIKQDVVYHLTQDVTETVQKNKDIF
jgi:hypothetical protein